MIISLIFVLLGYFNYWWLRGGQVGQKVLFRAEIKYLAYCFGKNSGVQKKHLAIQHLWFWCCSGE